MEWNLYAVVAIIAAFTMLVVIAGVIAERIISKRGFGVRSIQFVAIGMVPPLLMVLALEEGVDKGAIFALLGALVGYLFSNLGKPTEQKVDSDDA